MLNVGRQSVDTGVLARQGEKELHVWWLGLDKELEEMARACPGCAVKAAPPQSAVHSWEKTRGP